MSIAMCGLDCSECDAYLAWKNDDDDLRAKTAVDWTERYLRSRGDEREALKLEQINCAGCLSEGPVYLHCLECEVRLCGLERELTNCGECDDYPCEKITDLHKHTSSGQVVCDQVRDRNLT